MAESEPTVCSREEARERRLKHYFTGRPCSHGHLTVRFTCNGQCKACRLEAERKWRSKNPAVLERQRQWYWKNIDENRRVLKERARQQRASWTFEEREQRRKWLREWVAKNRERHLANSKKWAKRHPERIRKYVNDRRARKYQSGETHTLADIDRLFELQGERCVVCRVQLTIKTRRVDHIVALSRGGSNGVRNLQILCDPCNSEKRARDPFEFMRSRGMLL